MPPSSALPQRARSKRAIVLWVVLALVLLLLACIAWVAIRALMAKSDLESSVGLASTIQKQIGDGDAKGATATSDALAKRVHSARDLTSDPIWRAAEIVPLAGPNLTAVRQVSSVLSDVTDRAIGPLAQLAGTIRVSDFKPVDGAVDVRPLVRAQPVVATAAAALTDGLADARKIDTSDAVSQVDDAVARLIGVLQKASGAVDTADRVVRLLPAMLGAGGARNYLVLFQNNAELRATGGIPGALALLHVENGRLSLAAQASSHDFPHYKQPVLDLPVTTRGLYGGITGEYIQDVTLTPQFALSARLAREMWKRHYGIEVDGVISIDPVALSYLLKATGPIALPTGDQLSSDNAVKLLLSEVYARYTVPAQQDVFFATAASAVFSRVAHGDFDPRAMISALATAADERRVLLWSAHDQEQAILATTTLAGGLPVSTESTRAFGVYLNDATGAKMDYYLDVKVGLGQATCRKDGRPTYAVDVTLTNTAPADAGATLAGYVTGNGAFGVIPGQVRTNVLVYAPKKALYLGASKDGAALALHSATDEGYPVGQFQVQLAPGHSSTVRLEFLGAKPFSGTIVAETTPVINGHKTQEVALSCESTLK